MNALLTAIVLWLAANCGLPASFEHPTIERVPLERMSAQRFARSGAHGSFAHGEHEGQTPRQIVAIYNDHRRTIYLPENWTGTTPAELSVLVHEMAHHLQNTGKLTYECPAAREKLAYEAQEKWLALFGRDLWSEFEIDALTLKVSTACF
jgi:hypothetical protein